MKAVPWSSPRGPRVRANVLAGLLEDQGIADARLAPDARGIGGRGSLTLTVWPLEEGFTGGGLTVISEQDVLGDRLIRPKRKTKRAENYLTEAQSVSPGDLVVACRPWCRALQGPRDGHRDGRAA